MFCKQTVAEVIRNLDTSENGLNDAEVLKRQQKYGKNILIKKKRDGFLKIFIKELKDPMIVLLLLAIVASIIAGEIVDAIIIAVIILIDALMGTYQEMRANNTAESLERLVEDDVTVVRNNKKIIIAAEELVIGDYVLLESGDKISADMRLIETHNFSVDESALTGESLQVGKNTNPVRNTEA